MRLLFSLILVWLSLSAFADPRLAPSFTLPALAGTSQEKPIRLSDFSGKLVYLDFWASWCGPCKISFPDMVQLQSEFGDRDFQIVAISVDEQIADAERFMKRYPANFVVLIDLKGEVAAAYQPSAMPTSYLIDAEGVIRFQHTGYKPGDKEFVREAILERLR